jgi:hypothetical protein
MIYLFIAIAFILGSFQLYTQDTEKGVPKKKGKIDWSKAKIVEPDVGPVEVYEPPPPLTIREALKVARDRSNDFRFIEAVKTMLKSKVDEKQKVKICYDFLTDEKEVVRFDQSKTAIGASYDVYRLCAHLLKDPNAFFLSLLKHPVYKKKRDKGYFKFLIEQMTGAMSEIREPNQQVIDYVKPYAMELERMSFKLHYYARHSTDTELKKALVMANKLKGEERYFYIPRQLSQHRHRLVVFRFYIRTYLDLKAYDGLYHLIVDNKYYTHEGIIHSTLSDYSKVKTTELSEYIKLLDEVIAKKKILLNLKEEGNRLTEKEFSKVVKLREKLVALSKLPEKK